MKEIIKSSNHNHNRNKIIEAHKKHKPRLTVKTITLDKLKRTQN